jgi:hypothetical protein
MLIFYRLLSIGDGVDNLPCSVILTRVLEGEGGGEEVIGHARLMPVAGDCAAVFIETGKMIRTLIKLMIIIVAQYTLILKHLIFLYSCCSSKVEGVWSR